MVDDPLFVRPGSRAFVQGSIPSKDREPLDFYPTPRIGTEKLLNAEPFDGIVWEPACGDGSMSTVLQEKCKTVVSTDIHDYGFQGMRKKMDFLSEQPDFEFDFIVTNPPFTHTRKFCERALSLRPKKIAMLARLAFLEGKTRKEWFETSGLYRVLVFSTRINIPRKSAQAKFEKSGGMVAYAWYVWKRDHEGPPMIGWI